MTTRRLPLLVVDAPADRAWRVASGLLGAMVGASTCWWLCAWFEQAVPVSVALALASTLAGAAMAMHHLRPAHGRLVGTGQAWTWAPDAARSNLAALVVSVDVMIDAQAWMLLRLTPQRTAANANANTHAVPVWLPLSKAAAPRTWHVLRAAVHAPQPTPSVGVRP